MEVTLQDAHTPEEARPQQNRRDRQRSGPGPDLHGQLLQRLPPLHSGLEGRRPATKLCFFLKILQPDLRAPAIDEGGKRRAHIVTSRPILRPASPPSSLARPAPRPIRLTQAPSPLDHLRHPHGRDPGPLLAPHYFFFSGAGGSLEGAGRMASPKDPHQSFSSITATRPSGSVVTAL